MDSAQTARAVLKLLGLSLESTQTTGGTFEDGMAVLTLLRNLSNRLNLGLPKDRLRACESEVPRKDIAMLHRLPAKYLYIMGKSVN